MLGFAFAPTAVALAIAKLGPPLVPVTVSVPSGFSWTPPITITRTGSVLSTDFDITSLIPAATITYYVDPFNGSNTNSGLTRALPLKSLQTALAKTDADQIRIINMSTDYVARASGGWFGTQPSKSIAVINEGPGRFINGVTASSSLPTWTVNATYPTVYQATQTPGNANGIIDTSFKAQPQLADGTPLVNAPPIYRTYTKVSSVDSVAATPGSWYHDGTNIHVQAADSRSIIGDTKVILSSTLSGGRFPAAVNRTVYVEGIDFVGGRPFYATAFETNAITGTTLAAKDCSFQGGGVANGLAVEMTQSVYLYRCGAYYNFNDGFNYHCAASSSNAGLNSSPKAIEIECVAVGNGTTGSAATSDNASTTHEYTRVVRLNGLYIDSADRVLADTNNAQSWNLGCLIGQARETSAGKESIVAIDSAKTWLDTCSAIPGVNARWSAETATATIYHSNSGSVVNAAGALGTVTAYTG